MAVVTGTSSVSGGFNQVVSTGLVQAQTLPGSISLTRATGTRSEWLESNQRSLGPKPSDLPLSHALIGARPPFRSELSGSSDRRNHQIC